MSEKIKKVSMSELAPIIEELTKDGSTVNFTVVGNSMYPMLRGSLDSVAIKKTDKIKKYDIPLYKRENGEYILHRIVKTKPDAFGCCGDNQKVLEYPIYKEQIIGIVESFKRGKKEISCNNILYRIYSFVWVNLKFVRPVIYKLIQLRRRLKK